MGSLSCVGLTHEEDLPHTKKINVDALYVWGRLFREGFGTFIFKFLLVNRVWQNFSKGFNRFTVSVTLVKRAYIQSIIVIYSVNNISR